MVIKYIRNQKRRELDRKWMVPQRSTQFLQNICEQAVEKICVKLSLLNWGQIQTFTAGEKHLLYNHYLLPAARWFVFGGYCSGAGHV